jgi:hypothetical protein
MPAYQGKHPAAGLAAVLGPFCRGRAHAPWSFATPVPAPSFRLVPGKSLITRALTRPLPPRLTRRAHRRWLKTGNPHPRLSRRQPWRWCPRKAPKQGLSPSESDRDLLPSARLPYHRNPARPIGGSQCHHAGWARPLRSVPRAVAGLFSDLAHQGLPVRDTLQRQWAVRLSKTLRDRTTSMP